MKNGMMNAPEDGKSGQYMYLTSGMKLYPEGRGGIRCLFIWESLKQAGAGVVENSVGK